MGGDSMGLESHGFRDEPEKSGVIGTIVKPLELIVTATYDVVAVIRNNGA
jgi:hypothetical protein